MSNGNLAVSLIITDSIVLNPSNNHFYNESIVKNPGTGLMVLSPNNTILWSHTWMPENYLNDFIYITNMMTDASNNIYVSGRFVGSVDIDPTAGVNMIQPANTYAAEGFVIKFDANGNFIWNKRFRSPLSTNGAYCDLFDGKFLSNGNLRFTGSFYGNFDFNPAPGTSAASQYFISSQDNSNNGFFLTLDTSGNFIDAQGVNSYYGQAGITSNYLDNQDNQYVIYFFVDSIDIDLGSGVTMLTNTGENTSAYCIAKYDAGSNLLWSKQFDSDFGRPKMTLMNNHFYLLSNFRDTTIFNDNSQVISLGQADIVYEKWDLNGNCLWSKSIQNTGYAYSHSLIEKNNSLYVAYTYKDSINTNSGMNDTTLYANSIDLALSRFSLTGNHISTNEIKSDSNIYFAGRGLAVDGNQLRLTFRIKDQVDIDPSSSTQLASPQFTSPYSVVNAFWQDAPTGTSSVHRNTNTLTVFPNPAEKNISLELENNCMLSIYSTKGKLIRQLKCKPGINKINIENLAPGNYLFQTIDLKKQAKASKIITVR